MTEEPLWLNSFGCFLAEGFWENFTWSGEFSEINAGKKKQVIQSRDIDTNLWLAVNLLDSSGISIWENGSFRNQQRGFERLEPQSFLGIQCQIDGYDILRIYRLSRLIPTPPNGSEQKRIEIIRGRLFLAIRTASIWGLNFVLRKPDQSTRFLQRLILPLETMVFSTLTT
jgi:hypothetical protein